MAASSHVFDRLAAGYDEHFAVPHRRLYDDLAWELVAERLPAQPATVVDLGCGSGRWAPRLVELGHKVVGVEASAAMAEQARRRASALPAGTFLVHCCDMEEIILPDAAADLVIAMGSLQYANDARAIVAAAWRWLRPDGWAIFLVDSLIGLAVELLQAGKTSEAAERASTRRGFWAPAEAGGRSAEVRLFDRLEMEQILAEAGFVCIQSAGLLVGSVSTGQIRHHPSSPEERDELIVREAALAREPALADLGKQLLVSGRRPPDSHEAG